MRVFIVKGGQGLFNIAPINGNSDSVAARSVAPVKNGLLKKSKMMFLGVLLATGLMKMPIDVAQAQTANNGLGTGVSVVKNKRSNAGNNSDIQSVAANQVASQNNVANPNLPDYDNAVSPNADAIPPIIQSSTDAKYLLDYARQAMDKRNYSAAVYAYTKASLVDPTNAMAHYGLGWAKLNAGISDYNDIMNDINHAIALNGKLAIAYNTRGLVDILMNKYEDAARDFSTAISLDSNFEVAYTNRAYAKYNLQDYDGAILDYGIALVLNPGSALAYNNRALAKYAAGYYQSALYDINKAIMIDPKFGQAYGNRASIKQAMNIDGQTDLVKAKTYSTTQSDVE